MLLTLLALLRFPSQPQCSFLVLGQLGWQDSGESLKSKSNYKYNAL